MTLDAAAIRVLLPHFGDMCLLQSLERWTPETASCLSTSHQNPAHPLAEGERLGSANLIEYAAQAMALHGALLAGTDNSSGHGILAGVRRVNLLVDDLANISGPMAITVTLVSGDSRSALYDFQVTADTETLASGRATVMFSTHSGPVSV